MMDRNVKHILRFTDGKELELVANGRVNYEGDPFFIFGLHKSGSTLISNVFKDICKRMDIPSLSIPDELFSRGLTLNKLEKSNNYFQKLLICYNGFRYFWPELTSFSFEKYKKILLVRDPRDAMISYYFSMKSSHVFPGDSKSALKKNLEDLRNELNRNSFNDDTIKAFIDKQGKSMKLNMQKYISCLDLGFKVYRYEDIIFYKKEWILNMCEYLNIEIPKAILKEIVSKHDIIPIDENEKSHIRSVIPGNHKKHFSENIIDYLNDFFKDEIRFFGYDDVCSKMF